MQPFLETEPPGTTEIDQELDVANLLDLDSSLLRSHLVYLDAVDSVVEEEGLREREGERTLPVDEQVVERVVTLQGQSHYNRIIDYN